MYTEVLNNEMITDTFLKVCTVSKGTYVTEYSTSFTLLWWEYSGRFTLPRKHVMYPSSEFGQF